MPENAARSSWMRGLAGAFAVTLLGSVLTLGVVITPPAAEAAGTPLLNESFSGATVTDPAVLQLGDACLTAAASGSTPPAGGSDLSNCQNHQSGPVPTMGAANGWLQLTDTGGNRTGGILYNQALPATGGLIVTFDQAQYGGNGADGISFFLSDGAYELTAPGAPGGSLGYASRDAEPGVEHGFLGLALDAWGNYPRNSEGRGTGCVSPEVAGYDLGDQNNYRPNVTLRGPGRQSGSGSWTEGYCLWASTATNGASAAQNWSDLYNWNLRAANLADAIRQVRITIMPTDSSGYTSITVEIDPDGAGPLPYVQMLEYTTTVSVPDTYKFGFSSSTGGSNDIHLIRNLVVSTYNEIEGLGIVKSIDSSSPLYKAVYNIGDQIPYTFTLTNAGVALTNVQVHDPKIPTVTCPAMTLAAVGTAGSTMTCTGTYTVTSSDVITAAQNDNEFSNTANATGSAFAGPVTSNDSTAVVTLADPPAAIVLTKTADYNDTNSTGVVDAGDNLTYRFHVRNAGILTLTNVTITDAKLGLTNQACVATLAPGAEADCGPFGSAYQITDADVIAGTASNTATATGATPTPGVNVTSDSTFNYPTAAANAELSLVKMVTVSNGHTTAELGDDLTYTFRVQNTGTVFITNPRINDTKLGLTDWWGDTCVSTIMPGQYVDCVAVAPHVYTITNADLRAGSVVNVATANATPPTGVTPPNEATDTKTVLTASPFASITLVKTVDNGTTGATATAQDFTVGAEPHSVLIDAGQPIVKGTGDPNQAGGVKNVLVVPGEYWLKDYMKTGLEVYPGPPGYTPGAWSCVDQNNNPVTVAANSYSFVLTGTMDVTCSVTNTAIAGSLTWNKVDDATTPSLLTGSVWTLTGPSYPTGVQVTDCDATTPATCATGIDTNTTGGQFSLAGLAWGNYTLVETSAPLGYLIDPTVHSFTVTGSTNVTCVATGHTCIALGDFTNVQASALTLPLTGGLGDDWLLLSGGVLVILALGLSAEDQRRRSRATRKPKAQPTFQPDFG